MKKWLITFISFLSAFLIFVPVVHSAIPQPPPLENIVCEEVGIKTAIGCITFGQPTSMAAKILIFSIGIGGGIAILLISYAGFQMMTSSGDPRKLQASRELLTSALAGLFMLIMSIFILRIIGVNILGLF